jgi:CHAT domain-containing protein
VLRYLPFAALHDGQQFLVAKYGFALLTPAAKNLDRQPKDNWTIAGLGVSKGAPPGADNIAWAPLPAVPVELAEIVRSGDSDAEGILPGSVELDESFTASGFTEALEARPAVVHIASHFNFAPGTAADSYLLLGGGEKLSLADFQAGRYPMGGVDLLTLSACQTALGDSQRHNGREVEGFGAAAQNKGAASVLATLWSVADGSTGLFMREFYRRRQQEQVSKAQAMREVQLSFISGEVRPDTAPVALRGAMRELPPAEKVAKSERYTPPANAPFAHPFFWAPFILMGNWL